MPSPAFTIRGHHLGHYAELASWRSDPNDLANLLVETQIHNSKGSEADQSYAEDVIGTTPQEAQLIKDRYHSIFTKFVELESGDAVLITTGEKDDMCQCCLVGNHCVARGPEMAVDTKEGRLQVYEHDLADMRAITAFKKLAATLTANGKLDPALGTSSVAYVPRPTPAATPIIESNGITFETPIQASAGYVKVVLAHWGLRQRIKF